MIRRSIVRTIERLIIELVLRAVAHAKIVIRLHQHALNRRPDQGVEPRTSGAVLAPDQPGVLEGRHLISEPRFKAAPALVLFVFFRRRTPSRMRDGVRRRKKTKRTNAGAALKRGSLIRCRPSRTPG